MSTFVIAEAASAHDGKLRKALDIIDIAAHVGANACKFQFWADADAMASRRRATPYYRDVYRQYAMPAAWLPALRKACDDVGVEFMCTTFMSADIAIVDPFVARHKVSSFEVSDQAFVERVYALGKPVIVSTGMCDAAAVGHLIDAWVSCQGNDARSLTLMHCVSAYPAPVAQLQLDALRRSYVGQRSGHVMAMTGYSDHSGRIEVGAWAVAAGATTVEAHVRAKDTDPENPDGGDVALLPREFAQYVARIRDVDVALGSGKQVQPCESEMMAFKVRT